MIIDKFHLVEPAGKESVQKFLSQSRSRLVGRRVGHLRVVARTRETTLLHRLGHLAPHRIDHDVGIRETGGTVLVHHRGSLLDDIGVERAAERRVRCEGNNRHPVHLTRGHQWIFLPSHSPHQVDEHTVKKPVIRQHIPNLQLSLVELGRSDHLHRRSDRQGAADRADPTLYFLK